MRVRRAWTVLCTLSFFFHGAAALGESRWIVRGYAALLQPDGGLRGREEGLPALTTGVDDGFGLGAALEYRFGDRLGVELGTLLGQVDVDFDPCRGCSSATESLELSLLTLGLNFNLTPGPGLDLYLAPTLSYVLYDGFLISVSDLGVFSTFDPSDELAFGAAVGVDVPVSPSWSVNLVLRYVDTRPDTPAGQARLDADPVLFTVGFSLR